MPSVHMVYGFMRDSEINVSVTVIAFIDKLTKMHGAHVVEKEGADGEVAKRMIKELTVMLTEEASWEANNRSPRSPDKLQRAERMLQEPSPLE